MSVINIYCDESNHLENDNVNIMTLGAVYIEEDKVRTCNEDIRKIKIKNNVPVNEELKWTRVTKGRLNAYIELLEYYFDNQHLYSRTILIPNKNGLAHADYNQTHDDWYYKMHYQLIERIVEPQNSYNIYLDYKDSNMYYKGLELNKILNNKFNKYNNLSFLKAQPIRSHEVEIMQIVDIIIGAIAYKNKNLKTSKSKLKLIEVIEKRSNFNLTNSSGLRERKLNLFIWDIAGDCRDL